MNTFCEGLVWRDVSGPLEADSVGRHLSSVQPLFPDDERNLQRFNAGPETEQLYRDLTYALHEVERFLSNLITKDNRGNGCLCEK